MYLVVVLFVLGSAAGFQGFDRLDLPENHIPYYFNSFPEVADKCRQEDGCPYKDKLDTKKCWGYEFGCKPADSFARPVCLGEHKGWVKSKEDQINTFYSQGDFGYIRDQLHEMSVMCEPYFKEDSSLECSKHLRFCRGRNIMINFTSLVNRKERLRYKMDVLSEGDIGGHCRLHKQRLMDECDHISPLQSWGPELRLFSERDKVPIGNDCDVIVEKPTYLMKIDASVNMYHHFCDFFNLYASQHVNSSHPDTFSKDVHMLIWESYTYYSSFTSAWDVFTKHKLWDLNTFKGKVVCFKNLVFPLLPRMIFGLYYNTPLIWGCQKSGLFSAFSQHLLHRLKIPRHKVEDKRLRVTLLSRDTTYRNILNEKELIASLKNNTNYHVRRVVYNRNMPFTKQLEITHNSDIFIGIHGAGLTHLLFLPDWAVIFELYNCEDEGCYYDLARLRGVKYMTWKDKTKLKQQDKGHHPDGGAHAKFTNYEFDVKEFLRLVGLAAKYIKEQESYKEFLRADLHDEL
ncbi:hypothetical protein AAG570_001016 [Ranatra chinensis]|uniref:EGF domain-specific O-linked N-acetylglucosamine transferase n=1 Tax=Ranatra chinensis TaxID=642074 RepID=A0ABD0YPI3_9HEMI